MIKTEEKDIEDKCTRFCRHNKKEDAIHLIKKEYKGCSVIIDMLYSECGHMKMFMGSILYKSFNISF